MFEITGENLLRVWDELQFGLLVHRAVADTIGYSVDLSHGFDKRAAAALRQLHDFATKAKGSGTTRPLLLADAARRIAILTAYLESHPEESRKQFELADRLYSGAVEVGDGKRLSDQFSRALTGLERTLVMRYLGTLEPEDLVPTADLGSELLASVGLSHMGDELLADRVKGALHGHQLSVADNRRTTEAPVDDETRSPRERAHLLLSMGLAELAAGREAEAVSTILAAMRLVDDAEYGLFDQMDRQIDRIVAAWAFGLVTPEPDDKLRALDSAVRLIEEIRGGWQFGSSRSDPTHGPLQTVLTTSLHAVSSLPADDAGWVAMRIMEAMRRRQIAGMLRSVRFDRSQSTASSNSRVAALTDLVSLAEDQRLLTVEGDALVVHRFDGTVAEETLEAVGQEELLREELGNTISDFFAEAFLPEHVEVEGLRTSLIGWHVLAYSVLDARSMARVWVDPAGRATACVIDVAACRDRSAEFDWRGSGLPDATVAEYIGRPVKFAHEDLGETLSAALLPEEMRRNVAAGSPLGVLVVPDDWLSAVAWPALKDQQKRELIRSLDVAIVPSLSLVGDAITTDVQSQGGISACLDYSGSTWDPLKLSDENAFFSVVGTPVLGSIADLLVELESKHDALAWSYLASHGDDPSEHGESLGLGVELVERDSSSVTFLDVLAAPWPQLAIFAGCFTARLNWAVQTGLAPLGLAVAVLARGAGSVLGSTDLLDDRTPQLFVGWDIDGQSERGALLRTFDGQHPVRALAAAQRAWLERGLPWSAPLYWARAVVITQTLPAP